MVASDLALVDIPRYMNTKWEKRHEDVSRSSCGPSEDKIHKRMLVFHFDDQTS